jgi:hypothetical protein
VLLIAAHDRPFVGQIAVTPKPLLQIVSDPLTAEGPAFRRSAGPALSLPRVSMKVDVPPTLLARADERSSTQLLRCMSQEVA